MSTLHAAAIAAMTFLNPAVLAGDGDCDANGVEDVVQMADGLALRLPTAAEHAVAPAIDDFPSDAFTISLWMRFDSPSNMSLGRTLFSYAVGPWPDSYEVAVIVQNGVRVYVDGDAIAPAAAISLYDLMPHHVAVAWSSTFGGLRVVVDGEVVLSTYLSPGAVLQPGGTIVLGDAQSAPGTVQAGLPFVGTIDEVRLYDRSLTTPEILDDMSSCPDPTDPLAPMIWWAFDSAQPGEVPDRTGNHPASIVGATETVPGIGGCPEPDCDLDGTPDSCAPDCDADGLPDACEADCDLDGIPDDCSDAPDCDSNGIPDSCEADCDLDGVMDTCQIAQGAAEDCNGNGVPDECETITGPVAAWGYGGQGQTLVPDRSDVADAAAGTAFSLVLTTDGAIHGCGSNLYGRATPPAGHDFTAVDAGHEHGIALTTTGRIVAWGRDNWNQASPPSELGHRAIAAGGNHNVAIRADGSLAAWGLDYFQQLDVPEGDDFEAIACGANHSLALRTDGSVVGWGSNGNGQANAPGGTDFIAIAAGGNHSLALRSNGTVECWGSDTYGESSPPEGVLFSVIGAGDTHSMGLSDIGVVYGWGNEADGRTNAPSLPNALLLDGGDRHSIGITALANDCDDDGTPDSCEEDADGNGQPDDCQDFPCPSDLDGDGQTGFGDVLVLLSAWGPCNGCPEDLNGIGGVDFIDLLELLSRWGPCP